MSKEHLFVRFIRGFLGSRYIGIAIFIITALASFMVLEPIIIRLGFGKLILSNDITRSSLTIQGIDNDFNGNLETAVPSDLLKRIIRDELSMMGLAETASRLTWENKPWKMPAAGRAVGVGVPGFRADLRPSKPPWGSVIFRAPELPALEYVDGGTADLELKVEITTERERRSKKLLFDGGLGVLKRVQPNEMLLAMHLTVNSNQGIWAPSPRLTETINITPGTLRAEKPRTVDMRIVSGNPSEIFVRRELPESIPVTLTYQLFDFDHSSGGDHTYNSPKVLQPSAGRPFVDVNKSVAYSDGDATDFISIGGLNRFTVVVISADADLRRAVVASTDYRKRPIGRYSSDGTVFVAFSRNWFPIRVQVVATEPTQEINYRIHATSSDENPALPFFLHLGSLESRIVAANGVPENPAQTLEFLTFYSKAMALDFSSGDLTDIDNPSVRAIADSVSRRLSRQ